MASTTRRRTVSIIVWNSQSVYSKLNDQQWEDLIVAQRNHYTEFSQKHPEYSLRFYELGIDDVSKWDAILADIIKDVNEERGVPKESPWNAPNKQYNTLNIRKRSLT